MYVLCRGDKLDIKSTEEGCEMRDIFIECIVSIRSTVPCKYVFFKSSDQLVSIFYTWNKEKISFLVEVFFYISVHEHCFRVIVFVLSRCFMDFSVGVGAFIIRLSQISSFCSFSQTSDFICFLYKYEAIFRYITYIKGK